MNCTSVLFDAVYLYSNQYRRCSVPYQYCTSCNKYWYHTLMSRVAGCVRRRGKLPAGSKNGWQVIQYRYPRSIDSCIDPGGPHAGKTWHGQWPAVRRNPVTGGQSLAGESGDVEAAKEQENTWHASRARVPWLRWLCSGADERLNRQAAGQPPGSQGASTGRAADTVCAVRWT